MGRTLPEQYKIVVMFVLLVVCCFLTFYFHMILELGTFFTHFFYIPVILSALWWKRKGLLVAMFLAGLLISSHIFLRLDVGAVNDYLRAVMFIVVSLVVAMLSERITKTTENLLETSDYLKNLFSYANAPIIVWDPSFKITRFNHAFERLTGRNADGVIGKPLDILFPKDRQKESMKHIRQTLTGERWDVVEIPILRADGKVRTVLWNSATLYEEDGKTVRAIIAQGTDITDRKKAENQIQTSLKEKEILLKEIHHRVKNNLQVISSLLYLQSKNISDKKTLNMFGESQNRVKSIALVHEKLYKSEDLARIDFNEYVKNLINDLYRSYGINSDRIAMNTNVSNVFLSIDTAIPCGLIINELISNSMKHAFPKRNKGSIHIDFYSDKNKYVLNVGDNGIGLPKNLDFRNTKSLGLQLVNNLVHQLDGTIELNKENGTEFEITFTKLKYNGRSKNNGK